MGKSALGNPLALISVLTKVLCAEWTPVFSLSFLSTVLPAWSPPAECAAALSRGDQPLERQLQGVTANLLPAVPAGDKQLCGGQEGSGQSSKAEKVGV